MYYRHYIPHQTPLALLGEDPSPGTSHSTISITETELHATAHVSADSRAVFLPLYSKFPSSDQDGVILCIPWCAAVSRLRPRPSSLTSAHDPSRIAGWILPGRVNVHDVRRVKVALLLHVVDRRPVGPAVVELAEHLDELCLVGHATFPLFEVAGLLSRGDAARARLDAILPSARAGAYRAASLGKRFRKQRSDAKT